MPRFENTDPAGSTAIRDACRESGNGSSTFDLCHDCGQAGDGEPLSALDLTPYNGEPAGVLADVGDHPPYAECDYACDCCGAPLTADDD